MSDVDDRIVRMEFDNAKFEQNIATTMNTLSKFENALKFDRGTDGLDKIQRTAKNVNFANLEANIDSLTRRFSFVGERIRDVQNQIFNFGKNTLKNVTVKPMIDGFSEYETQMKSIQTISANTGLKGEKGIAKINAALDELNEYADKTIYNFSEMTRNIGTFTAAGVDLDTSVSSIQGIANLAAMSGSTSQQASTAMYQLSQAIAAGTVKLQDWNSVVNAGMGGQVFQDALKRTARAHGIAVDEMIDKAGSFRESLKEGWITSEVLTDTLTQLTMTTEGLTKEEIARAKAELVAQGYSEKDAQTILDLADASQEAATKVRTWTQLWDTVGEALGSGWAQSWRIIIGDFNGATEVFTWLSDRITGIVGDSADARNALLEDWAAAGGRNSLFEGVKTALAAIQKPIDAVADGFSSAFNISGKGLAGFTENLGKFLEKLVISDHVAHNLANASESVFSVVRKGIEFTVSVGGKAVDILLTVGRGFLDVLELSEDFAQLGISSVVNDINAKFEEVNASGNFFVDLLKNGAGHLKTFTKYVGNLGTALSTGLKEANLFKDISFDDFKHGKNFDKEAVIGKKGWAQILSNGFGTKEFKEALKQAARDRGVAVDKFIEESGSFAESLRKKKWLTKDVFDDAVTAMNDPVKRLERIGGRLQGVFKRMGDWLVNVTHLRPVVDLFGEIGGKLKLLAQGADDFFGVSTAFAKTGDSVAKIDAKPMEKLVTSFESARSKITGFYSEFEKAPKKTDFLADSVKKIPGVFKKAFNKATNFAKPLFDQGKAFLKKYPTVYNALKKISNPLKTLGRGISEVVKSISNGMPTFQTVEKAVQRVKDTLANFSKGGLPSFGEAIGKLKDIVVGKVKSIWNYLTSLNPQKIIEDLGGFFDTLKSNLENFAPSFAPGFGNFADTFLDKLKLITGSSETFKDVFDNMCTSILKKSESLPGPIKAIFDGLVNTVKYAKDNISKLIENLSLGNAQFNLGLGIESLGDLIGKGFQGMIDGLLSVPDIIGGIFDDIVEKANDVIENFPIKGFDDLAKIGGKILNGGLIVSLILMVNNIKDLAGKVSKYGDLITQWPTKLGEALARFGEGFNAWRKETKADAIVKVATALIILAAALFVIASIPADDLTRAGKAMGIMAAGLVGFLALFAILDKAKALNAATLTGLGAAVTGLGVGVLALAAACGIIALIPVERLWDGVGAVFVLLGAASAFAKALGDNGASLFAGSVGLIALGVAIGLFVKAISALGEIATTNYDAYIQGLEGFVVIVLALSVFGAYAAEAIGKLLSSVLKFGIGVAALGIGIGLLAGSLVLLSAALSYITNLPEIILLVAGALIVFSAAAWLLKEANPQELGTGLILFGVSLLAMAGAFYIMNTVDLGHMALSMFAFGVAIAAFVIAVKTLEGVDLIKAAGSFVIFGAALIVIAAAFKVLETVNLESIAGQLIVMALALAVFLGASALASYTGIAQGMLMVGGAVALFGVGLLAGAAAIYVFSLAIDKLANTAPEQFATVGTGIGTALANALTSFIGTLFNIGSSFLGSLAQGAVAGLQAIGGTLVGIGKGVVDFLTGNTEEAEAGGAKLAEHVGQGYANQSGNLRSTIASNTTSSVQDATKDTIDQRRQAGREVMTDMAEGATEEKGALSDAAEQGVTDAQSTVQNMPWAGLLDGKGTEAIQNFGPEMLEGVGISLDQLPPEAAAAVENGDWSAFSSSFTGVGESGGQAILDGFGTVDPTQMVEQFGGKLTTGFQGLPENLQLTGGDVGAGFAQGISGPESMQQVYDAAKSLGERAEQGTRDATETHSPSEKFRVIGNNLSEGLVLGITESSPMVQAAGVTMGAAVVKGFTQALNNARLGPNTFRGLLNSMSSAMSESSAIMNRTGRNIVTALAGAISANAARIATPARSMQTAITTALSNLPSVMQRNGASAVSHFAAGITSTNGKVTSAAKVLVDKLGSGLKASDEKARSAGQSAVNAFVSALANKAGSAYSTGKSVGGSASRGLSDGAGGTWGVGANFGQGFINGMNSKSSGVWQTAWALGRRAVDAVKAATNTHSPSREAMQVGEFFGQGFTIGIESYQKYVEKASENLGFGAVDTIAESIRKLSVNDLVDTTYTPVVTPVLDPVSFNSSLDSLMTLQNMSIGSMSMSGTLDGSTLSFSQLASIETSNRELIGEIQLLRAELQQWTEAAANSNIVMDSGELVGALAPVMDDALGQRQSFAQRGMF